MRRLDQYLSESANLFPDGRARETPFRSSGDMVEAARAPVAGSAVTRFLGAFALWRTRRGGRYALRELDDRLLRDVGLTREAARGEARKSRFLLFR